MRISRSLIIGELSAGFLNRPRPGREHIPSQDHCISYIRTLELVKAKHARELGNIGRNHRQRIEVISILHLHYVHALMCVLHEVVEVNARLVLDVRRQRIKEQIHQHRLAAPDIAIHVQSLRKVIGDSRLFLLPRAPAEQRPKEGRLLLRVERLGLGVNNFRRVVIFQRFKEVL